jgi:hypothetical protein
VGRVFGAIAVVIIAALFVWLIRYKLKQNERIADKEAGRPVNGDLTAAQEKALIAQIDEIEQICQELLKRAQGLDALHLTEVVVLPDEIKGRIELWLLLNKKRRKDIS